MRRIARSQVLLCSRRQRTVHDTGRHRHRVPLLIDGLADDCPIGQHHLDRQRLARQMAITGHEGLLGASRHGVHHHPPLQQAPLFIVPMMLGRHRVPDLDQMRALIAVTGFLDEAVRPAQPTQQRPAKGIMADADLGTGRIRLPDDAIGQIVPGGLHPGIR